VQSDSVIFSFTEKRLLLDNTGEWMLPKGFIRQYSSTAVPTTQSLILKGERPLAFKCPFCDFEGIPATEKKGLTGGGWALFAVLMLICFPLFWLPFVIDGCKQEHRKCVSCGSKL
jgi:lipopolysaccharide-induced tumor necrosis factor-alpha factor